MGKRLLIATAFMFVLMATPAGAATVSQSFDVAFLDTGDFDGCGRYAQCGTKRTVEVDAAPGERNTLTAELADPSLPLGDLIVRDTGGAPLDVAFGSNCTVTAPSEVTCTTPPPPYAGEAGDLVAQAVIWLGDGDDSVRAGQLPMTAYGEAGADIMTATSAAAVFYGGAGLDTLHGGPGNDSFYGGEDRDHLYGAAGNDYLAGMDGDDELFGQLGNDKEIGDGGRDLVDGGSGRDWLIGGSGRDALLGRAGADRLSSRDKTKDRVSCGSGKSRDRVTADRKDKISGCEKRSLK